LRKNKIDKIKISQNSFQTMRLLIENKTKLKINFKRSTSSITISIKTGLKQKSRPKIVKSATIAPKRLDRNKIIVIDAGHGGKDPGAIGYKKYREKVVVLSIARDLYSILKSRGFKVYMTRNKDYFVKLSNRTKYANKKDADIFISIHANAVAAKNADKAQGIETYFLSKSRSSRAKKVAAKENQADLSEMDYYGKESFLNTINSHNIVAANKLAIDLQRGALGVLNKHYKHVKDAGVREGPFWVLVGAQMPAVLVEVGFITNPTEAKRLVNARYQKSLATGLANGVERYFLNN
jgi:N-acetylmuramoyl-L-alanine amidase